MKVRAEYVNPFIEAGIRVIKQVAGLSFRKGHLTRRFNAVPSFDTSIVIGVYGYLHGQVVYSMAKDMADRLVGKMLSGVPPQEANELYSDTLGELANMITGAATSILNGRDDLSLKVTTPAVITGTNLNISFVSTPTIGLSLYSSGGPIEINIALE